MRFYFHIVFGEKLYADTHGAECESIPAAVENARLAIAELKRDEQMSFSAGGYFAITCEQLRVAIILPLDES